MDGGLARRFGDPPRRTEFARAPRPGGVYRTPTLSSTVCAVAQNPDPRTIYDFIVNDFEDAWNSVAHNPSARGRGNFMFARQVMTLLEWAAMLCRGDTGGTLLPALSLQLAAFERRYFTRLPGPCADFGDIELPHLPFVQAQAQLLWAIFDLVRNGQAHQYLQIAVDLQRDGQWSVGLSGADLGLYLDRAAAFRGDHLRFWRQAGTLIVVLRPEILFLHVRAAIEGGGLLEAVQQGVRFPYLTRPMRRLPRRETIKGPFYDFDVDALERALIDGGHERVDGVLA